MNKKRKNRRAGELGKLLLRLRERRGLTQQQVADGAGISQGHVSQLESGGRVVPNLRTAEGLAKTLEVSLLDLIADGHKQPEPVRTDTTETTE